MYKTAGYCMTTVERLDLTNLDLTNKLNLTKCVFTTDGILCTK